MALRSPRPSGDGEPPAGAGAEEPPDGVAPAPAPSTAAGPAPAPVPSAGAAGPAPAPVPSAGAAQAEDPDSGPVPAPSPHSGSPPAAIAGAPSVPVVVPRWIQLVVLPLALLGLWALARASGTVLLILLAASTVALILNPLVRKLVRLGLPRGLSIFLLYVAVFAFIAGLGVLLANPISAQISHFERDFPQFVNQANHDLANLQRWLDRRGIHVQVQQQGQTALQTLQHYIVKRSASVVSFSRDLLTQIVTTSFDLVLTFVLSIYLLAYGDDIGRLVRRVMPPGDGSPEDDYPLLVQRAVFGYVRGQFLFSLIMGASAAFSLWIFGVVGIFPSGETYAVFFGAFYGLMEFIPYIGPIIGPLPAVLVALFVNPISAVWVILLFIALQQLEGHFVAPQVFRISLRINPILIILALLIGYQLYGIAGALLALPIAAVIRQTVLYLRRHLVLEPWGQLGSGVLSGVGVARCEECGASAGPRDAYCRSCGASLSARGEDPRMPGNPRA